MNREQVGMLLAEAAIVDNRKLSPSIVTVWHKYLERVEYPDAVAALDWHRVNSTDYLQPSHIVAGVKRIRAQRLAGETQPEPPTELADDSKGAIGWIRRQIKAIGDGWSIDAQRGPRALPPGRRRPGPPPDEFVERQAEIEAKSAQAKKAPLPPVQSPDLTGYEPAKAVLAGLGPDTQAAFLAKARANLGDDAPTYLVVIHAADLATRTDPS